MHLACPNTGVLKLNYGICMCSNALALLLACTAEAHTAVWQAEGCCPPWNSSIHIVTPGMLPAPAYLTRVTQIGSFSQLLLAC